MHVGVEEAVAQRVAQKTLDHLAAEIGQVDLRLCEPRMIVQRDAVDPLHRQHVVRGAVPVDRRHAKIRIVARVLRHLRQRSGFQPQVHLHRDRARHRVDDLDQAQPPRFGRIGFGLVRDEEEIGEVAAETRGDVGPQHLDRNRLADAVAHRLRRDAPARSRRRRPRGPRLANAFATGRSSDVAITASASACENGGRRSCRLSRSRAMTTPTTSGRVARNWPSLR